MGKKFIIISIILIGALLIIGFFIMKGLKSTDSKNKELINQIYEDYFSCTEKCPEDNNGYVKKECWKVCNGIAEGRFYGLPSSIRESGVEIKSELDYYQYVQNAITKKNSQTQKCIEACADSDINLNYRCVHNCFK